MTFRINFNTNPPTADRVAPPPGLTTDPVMLANLTQYDGLMPEAVGFAWYSDERYEETPHDAATHTADPKAEQILEINTGDKFVRFTRAVRPLSTEELAEREAERQRQEAEAVKAYDAIVQKRIDDAARSLGYGDPNNPSVSPIVHAVGYADEPAVVEFQAEGRLLRAFRSRTWKHCADMLAEVKAGTRTPPTEGELLAELDAAVPMPTEADVAAEIARLSA